MMRAVGAGVGDNGKGGGRAPYLGWVLGSTPCTKGDVGELGRKAGRSVTGTLRQRWESLVGGASPLPVLSACDHLQAACQLRHPPNPSFPFLPLGRQGTPPPYPLSPWSRTHFLPRFHPSCFSRVAFLLGVRSLHPSPCDPFFLLGSCRSCSVACKSGGRFGTLCQSGSGPGGWAAC